MTLFIPNIDVLYIFIMVYLIKMIAMSFVLFTTITLIEILPLYIYIWTFVLTIIITILSCIVIIK